MTIHRSLNVAGLGGNYTTWEEIQVMLAASHTMDASGSGIGGVYSAVGSVFKDSINPVSGSNVTAIGVGVGDEHWGGRKCWALMTSPDGSQLCIQRDSIFGDSYDDEWAYGYSPGGNFNLGAADEETPPTATDLINLWGTLGSAWSAIHTPGGTTNLIHVAADDAPSPDGMNGLICLEFIATNVLDSIVCFDDFRTDPTISGDFNAHAKSWYLSGQSTALAQTTLYGAGGFDVIKDYGGGAEQQIDLYFNRLTNFASTPLYPGNAGTPSDGEVPFPVPLGNHAVSGFAGLSRWFRWPAFVRPYNARSLAEDLWYVGDVQIQDLPDGSTIPATIP
jgi:hypothetical protein